MAEDDTIIQPNPAVHWPSLLRQYRFTQNMKQAVLAADLGVTQAMVSRWESGRTRPGPRMQARILDLVQPRQMGAPMVGWRDFVRHHPSMAGVIDEDGIAETVSAGALRELGVSRQEIEGRNIASFLAGDFINLFETLRNRGLFSGHISGAESADLLEFRRPDGEVRRLYAHGLHWARRDVDGRRRWVASGARVSEEEFLSVRSDLGGQIEIISN